jgi:hypothetical protein
VKENVSIDVSDSHRREDRSYDCAMLTVVSLCTVGLQVYIASAKKIEWSLENLLEFRVTPFRG